ncbi:MAG: hypothetical protein KC478_01435 [Bacteriovoracaceae bacterium]|nr:hypothetical protein [Bacteriovoracaceae bacterium]
MAKCFTGVLTLLFLLTGCKEQSFSAKDSESSAVIKALNKSDYKSVISILERKEENEELSVEDQYIMASAFAIKGGMDIYSLFPLMEVELFHKRAIDWNELEEQKDPYSKFLTDNTSSNATVEEREKAWDNYVEASLATGTIEEEFNCDVYEDRELCEYMHTQFEKVRENLEKGNFYYSDRDRFISGGEEARREEIYALTETLRKESNDYSVEKYQITRDLETYYIEIVVFDYKRDKFISGELKDEGGQASKDIMKLIWRVYESIPLIQRLPKIDHQQQTTLTTVLDILKENMVENPSHEKSSKMIAMTLFFSIASIFADSFNLEAVESPLDIGCQIQEDKLVGHLDILKDRIEYVTKLSEMGLLKDVPHEYFDGIREYLDSSNEHIGTEDKSRLLESIRTHKVRNCGPSIFLHNT